MSDKLKTLCIVACVFYGLIMPMLTVASIVRSADTHIALQTNAKDIVSLKYQRDEAQSLLKMERDSFAMKEKQWAKTCEDANKMADMWLDNLRREKERNGTGRRIGDPGLPSNQPGSIGDRP